MRFFSFFFTFSFRSIRSLIDIIIMEHARHDGVVGHIGEKITFFLFFSFLEKFSHVSVALLFSFTFKIMLRSFGHCLRFRFAWSAFTNFFFLSYTA